MHEISGKIQDELVRGLEGGASSIAMLPSFVPALPDGNGMSGSKSCQVMKRKLSCMIFFEISEVGKYIAIDLSGKNLRIMLLTLKGSNQEPDQINHNYVFPVSVMKGTGDQARFFLLLMFYAILCLLASYEILSYVTFLVISIYNYVSHSSCSHSSSIV